MPMQTNSFMPIEESPGRLLNPLPTPNILSLNVDDVFGTNTLATTVLLMAANYHPSDHETASQAALSISFEGLLMDTNSCPSEAQKPSQSAPQSQLQNERALALTRLLQPPVCAKDFPYILLPPY